MNMTERERKGGEGKGKINQKIKAWNCCGLNSYNFTFYFNAGMCLL